METLAPGERNQREGQRTEETRTSAKPTEIKGDERARWGEEQEEEERPTAPTLGKFGVTRGDEDKREELARCVEKGRERGWRTRTENDGRRENLLGADHRPQGWTRWSIATHYLRHHLRRPGLFLRWITRRASNLPKRSLSFNDSNLHSKINANAGFDERKRPKVAMVSSCNLNTTAFASESNLEFVLSLNISNVPIVLIVLYRFRNPFVERNRLTLSYKIILVRHSVIKLREFSRVLPSLLKRVFTILHEPALRDDREIPSNH